MAKNMVIPSKEMARIMDNFEERIINAIWLMAIDIKGTYEDAYVTYETRSLPEDVSTVYYDYDYKAQVEEMASEIIKEAYGFTFESDGTSF